MKFSVKVTSPEKQQNTCLILGVFEEGKLTATGKKVDTLCHGTISKLLKEGIFQGKLACTLPLFQYTPFACLVLVGCGKEKNITPILFKKIAVAAIRAACANKVVEATCYLTELPIKRQSLPWKVKQLAEATGEACYRFDTFKTEKEPPLTLKELIIDIPHSKYQKPCDQAFKQGQAIAEGVTFTKNLANLPSNICTPHYLAQQAKELAKNYPALSVKILEEREMKKLGMGALLAVSQGSAQDAKLICLQYNAHIKRAPLALVGKGITFDTGGNSLKSPENMVGMKYDMCGAATVLGIMKVAAMLKLPVHLIGIIPAVENMPGGTAYKPEDILTSLSGQTIEVISTDAEGRLILADALTYCERYKPDVVIDIATLTGAVVVSLGMHAIGLLSNHQPLANALLAAGEESNDRAWQLPLWDDYQDQIKSPFADMANSGGRSAGTITAACFLSRFTKNFRWAHLDIAGTGAMMMGTTERMATGRPVPLLMQYIIRRARK
ncbi:MAG: leucyl aminopeptidase [Gammaproteobacteria bacterium RIFCSPHIGHO2_12_FULL_37_34]|nr:MAG: leucyl aminopeptidase [Gammaproteobacteria bacterium RIFCSPHIGHO2_12_FULL_37_34]